MLDVAFSGKLVCQAASGTLNCETERNPLDVADDKQLSKGARTAARLLLCVGGVLSSLCIYGVLQERIMTMPYKAADGTEGIFKCSIFLVLMNRAVAVCISFTGMVFTEDPFVTSTPLSYYAIVAFSNLVTTLCQYEVLKYLSFAVSTLSKCAKIVPVMIWGRTILGKQYSVAECAAAVAVTLGCAIFVANRGLNPDLILRKGGRSGAEGGGVSGGSGILSSLSDHKGWVHQYALGGVIMLIYLGFDGFTSTFQQKLFTKHSTTILNQIFFTTMFTTFFSFVWLIMTAQLSPVATFVAAHPQSLQDILVLSVASCVSQFAISYTIYSFGAVILATIMTFRQFLSVPISCYLFGQGLTGLQWVGVVLVLAPVGARLMKLRNNMPEAEIQVHLLDNKDLQAAGTSSSGATVGIYGADRRSIAEVL